MTAKKVDSKQISWGQIWKLKGYPRRHFIVLGNCWRDDGTIWLIDDRTGEQVYGHRDKFVLDGEFVNYYFSEPYFLYSHLVNFAFDGHAHVMDWLGWYFEGRSDRVSLLFYLAGMRKDKTYARDAHRVLSDLCIDPLIAQARARRMKKHRAVEYDEVDNRFCLTVPELATAMKTRQCKIESDWLSLVKRADALANENLFATTKSGLMK